MVRAEPVKHFHKQSKFRRWSSHPTVKQGVSFGTALAIVLSYTKNASILWAIIHGLFSWFYVIYRVLF